jgi:hypothetical protein
MKQITKCAALLVAIAPILVGCVVALLASGAQAQVLPCTVTITAPTNNATLSGTVPVSITETCQPGTPSTFYRVYVAGTTFQFGGGTYEWDTTTVPNGASGMGAIAWDATGLIKEGETSGINITIANGVATPIPTAGCQCVCPTPAATFSFIIPTPTPISSASPSPVPTRTPLATPTPMPVMGALIRANDFLNSMGVVTHDIQQKESATAITNGFIYTGLRIGRDDATHNTSGVGSVQDLCNIHAATGVLYDELPIVDSDPNNVADTKAEWDQLAGCGAMLQAEGPNEPNNQPFFYNGQQCNIGSSFMACGQYQAAIYQMVKADPLLKNFKMVGIAEVGAEPDDVGLQFLTIPSGAGTLMPAGTVFADVANAHNYIQGNGGAGTTLIDNHVRYAETIARSGPYAGLWDGYGEYWGNTWNRNFPGGITGQNDRPKVTTETGWNIYAGGGHVTYDQAGRLETDVYLDGYQLGWSETIIYKMFDEPPYNSGNGLFSPNGNEADAGNANAPGLYIHNLTTILSDNSSSFTPKAVNFTVSNVPPTGYFQLMEKSSGAYELVLWGEAFASETSTAVTVNLPSSYPVVKVYDITKGTSPVTRLSNASSVTLTLTDHALVVEF